MNIEIKTGGPGSSWGPATILVVAIVVVCVIAGAVVTIVHPETLSFPAYLERVEALVAGTGLLAIGRGAQVGLTRHGEAVGRGIAQHGAAVAWLKAPGAGRGAPGGGAQAAE